MLKYYCSLIYNLSKSSMLTAINDIIGYGCVMCEWRIAIIKNV